MANESPHDELTQAPTGDIAPRTTASAPLDGLIDAITPESNDAAATNLEVETSGAPNSDAADPDTLPTEGDTAYNPPSAKAVQSLPEQVVADLPPEVLAFLVRSAPQRAMWKWLSEDEQRPLLYEITRGFQNTPQALRQPVVRTRLARQIQQEGKFFTALLKIWADAAPAPTVVAEVHALDDETLRSEMPALWRRHGSEALLLALLFHEREVALEDWATLAEAGLPPDGAAEPPVEEAGSTETSPDASEVGYTTPSEEADNSNAITASEELLAKMHSDLERARQQGEEWRRRMAEAESGRAMADQALATARLAAQQEKRAREVQTKQEQRRAATTEEELQGLKKNLDRTARRLRHVEKESAEQGIENKRLKRQLRQQQQISEELRKQLARAEARLKALEPEQPQIIAPAPAPPAAPVPKPPAPITPYDQTFIWMSYNRSFRVTPREIKRAIDRNDEDFVFSLIQAFDALQQTNMAGYKLILQRMRELGRYYERVLTADTTRVLIDASNVARFETDRRGKGPLRHLLAVRDELRRRDCFPIGIYADASLPYNIDDPGELMAMVKKGEVIVTPSGTEADETLAREARRTGAYVVTNDRNFHLKVAPDFEPPRVTFRIYDGTVIVDDF